MIHVAIVVALGLCLVVLVRRGLIQVDLSFPWLVAIVLFGFLSTIDEFVAFVAALLGIIYPPIAIVLVTIFIVFALITVLLIGVSQLRRRQIHLVRYIAAADLARQEEKSPRLGED